MFGEYQPAHWVIIFNNYLKRNILVGNLAKGAVDVFTLYLKIWFDLKKKYCRVDLKYIDL